MWYFILTTIIFVTYLLEAIISLPLFLIVVIAHASFDQIKMTAFISFLAGILADLAGSRPLGETSLFFLFTSLIVQLYRKSFREESIGFLFFSTFIITQIYLWVFQRGFLYLVQGLISSLLVIATCGILYSLKPKK